MILDAGPRSLVLNREVVYSEAPPIPRNMMVSLANTCNHKCVFCYNKKIRAEEKSWVTMSESFLSSLLCQAYNLGVREVGFYTVGEPFMSPLLEDAVVKASDIGYEYIYLTTNGVLAKPDRVEKLFRGGLHSLKFSVNAGRRETYKLIHGKDNFDIVLDNIATTNIIRNTINPNISIFASFIECSLNLGEATVLERILREHIDKLYVFSAENISGLMYDEFKSGIVAESSVKRCDMLFNRLHVTPEGYLSACCADFVDMMVVADLNFASLEDAWHNEKFSKLRRQHLEGNLPDSVMCYNCINNTNKTVVPI